MRPAFLAITDRHRASVADTRAARGYAARLCLDYRTAAAHFAEAASLMNRSDADNWRFRVMQAGALFDQGVEFGDNAALHEAIAVYGQALRLVPRERVPLDWATTQNNLGIARLRLGERESGTDHLQQAVAAFQQALLELTRKRVPRDWANIQNNLGIALRNLGERDKDSVQLCKALRAHTNAWQAFQGVAPYYAQEL